MEPNYQGKSLSEWVAELRNGEVADRCAAALALAEIGPEKQPVMNALVHAMLDPDKAVQMASAIAIGFVPMDVQARRNILHDLSTGDDKVRQGWMVMLRWTQSSGGDAPAAPVAATNWSVPPGMPTASPRDDSLDDVPDVRYPTKPLNFDAYDSPAPLQILVYAHAELDEPTQAYLADIAKKQGAGRDGVFLPRASATGWTEFFPAAVFLALTIGSCWLARVASPAWANSYFTLQLAVTVLACLFLVRAIRKVWATRSGLGSFLYADRAYVWEVEPLRVKAIPMLGVTNAVCRTEDTAISGWVRVGLSFLGHSYALGVFAAEDADELVAFVHEHAGRDIAEAAPEQGSETPRLSPPTWSQRLRRLVPSMAAVVLGAVTATLLLPVNRLVREEFLHTQILQAEGTLAAPHLGYLAEFPAGRYVDEVQARLLTARLAEAEHDKSPAPLRKFLTECHAPDLGAKAQKEIAASYERASAAYRRAAADANGDRELVQGLGDLLKSLGATDRVPSVPVTFRGRHDVAPTDQVQKFMEDLARRDAKHGVMKMPPESLFAADSLRKREKLLLERLNRALSARLTKDFVTLAAESREKPVIEVAYHVKPAGDFFTWRETNLGNPPILGWPKMKAFDPLKFPNLDPLGFPRADPVWLVRQYNIDWTVTITPPNAERLFMASSQVVNLRQNLRWTTKDFSDPKRDPYLFIMDVMGYDFSDQLISAFGLPPQSRPAVEAKEN